MDLVLKLLPFYLLSFWWTTCIFYKISKLDSEGNSIYIKASEIKSPMLRGLAIGLLDCELCLESWIGFAASALLACAFQDYYFALYAPVGAAFSNLVKTLPR